jgi:hypothetical protein
VRQPRAQVVVGFRFFRAEALRKAHVLVVPLPIGLNFSFGKRKLLLTSLSALDQAGASGSRVAGLAIPLLGLGLCFANHMRMWVAAARINLRGVAACISQGAPHMPIIEASSPRGPPIWHQP